MYGREFLGFLLQKQKHCRLSKSRLECYRFPCVLAVEYKFCKIVVDVLIVGWLQTLNRVFTVEYAYPPFLIALGMSVVGVAVGAALEWAVRAAIGRPHSDADPLEMEGNVLPLGQGTAIVVAFICAASIPSTGTLPSVSRQCSHKIASQHRIATPNPAVSMPLVEGACGICIVWRGVGAKATAVHCKYPYIQDLDLEDEILPETYQ